MAGRLSLRPLARQIAVGSKLRSVPHDRRGFTSAIACREPHNFTMPAMSPTMTEGNISAWKVKEGESFAAGDILLEIETDKASMDVEAQDDGVMAKIFAGDGSKGIQVGTRIAVLADPGDDIASLDIPPDDAKTAQPAANKNRSNESRGSETPRKQDDDQSAAPAKAPTKGGSKTKLDGPGQNPKYPYYPAVIALIHENHLSDQDAAKIPATGPNGRLLKGDILSYLGAIDGEYSASQSKRIEHMAHLNLSNIKVLSSPPTPATAAPTEAAPAPQAPKVTSVCLPISLAEVLNVQKRIKDTLGVTIPLSTFLARAVDLANDDLPQPKDAKPSADDLFNAVLGLDTVPATTRGTYLPQIDAWGTPSLARRTQSRKPDIIDFLTQKSSPPRTKMPLSTDVPGRTLSTVGGAVNLFSVSVPPNEEQRARIFLERVKTVLQAEPGRLVL